MIAKRVASRAAWVLVLGALGGTVFGQTTQPAEITGDWKALMDVGGPKLRLVLHVTKTGASYAASLDSLDQAALGLAVDTLRRDGTHLHFEMTQLSAHFDGDWNPASSQFEGLWTQGPATFPVAWKQAPAGSRQEKPVSNDDRLYLVTYLQKTRDDLLRTIAHLTPAQWTFKADPSRWSIAECVEHLVREEQTMFQAVTRTVVRIPLPDDQARSGHEQDRRIIQFMTDRSQKMNAAEAVQPHGKLATVEEGIAEFSKARSATIDWVTATPIDLRAYGTPNPDFHYLDAYGYWILVAAHSARHTAQIAEVMSAAGYPR